jgi:hypothetical protein
VTPLSSHALEHTCCRQVRDLFQEKDMGVFQGSYSDWVNPDGVIMLRLSKPKHESSPPEAFA